MWHYWGIYRHGGRRVGQFGLKATPHPIEVMNAFIESIGGEERFYQNKDTALPLTPTTLPPNSFTMPHSIQKRKQIHRRKKYLNGRVKQLTHFKAKILATANIIKLNHISLGDLRARFKPTHYTLHPAVLRREQNFTRYESDPSRPLLIYGSDGGLLACRIRLRNSNIATHLFRSIESLPPITKKHRQRGINRSEYEARHYSVWSPYSKKPFNTSEQRLDGLKAMEFLKSQRSLWKEMSDLLGALAPGVFKDFCRYPIHGLQRACDAWAACVINRGGNDPWSTNIHRDVKESQFGYSCIASCGNYTKGDLILWDLGIKVELSHGDLFLFPDSLIHHSNEAAQGVRNSVVTFTQENMYDFWATEFGMNLKRKMKKNKKTDKS